MFEKFLTNILNTKLAKKYRGLIMTVSDLVMVFMSFGLSYFFRYGQKIVSMNHMHILQTILLSLVIYLISFCVFGIYRSLWKYISSKELVILATAVGVATLILIIIDPFFSLRGEIILYVLSGVLSFFLMADNRFIYRYIRYNTTPSKKSARAIIIGAGNGGYLLLKELTQNKDVDVNVIGFVDDKRAGHMISGVKVLGTTEDIPALVKKCNVNRLYIAMPSANKKDISRVFNICQSVAVKTMIMRSGVDLLSDSIHADKVIPQDVSIEDLLGRGEVKLNQDEIREYITGKTIIVTGAGGSIGSELCRQISRFKPKRLVMLDINENGLYMLEQEFNRYKAHNKIDKDIEIISYIASIREAKAIDEIFSAEKPNAVYHAAAHKHVPLMETRPTEAIKNNVFGTNNIIQACIKNKIPRFIMISTDKAVNPTNVMGATKRMTELLLQAHGNNGVTKMAAVRFGNVLGSNGSVIPIFKNQIAEGGPVTITDKKITRYFMTIPEAAQLVLQAGYYADKGEIFVLDMGEPVKILDLAEKMIRLSGLKPYEDMDIVEIGLRPGEKMYEELRLEGESTSKTKNDLIFVNHVIGIEKEEVDSKLDKLHGLIEKDKVSNNEVRNTLLHIIK